MSDSDNKVECDTHGKSPATFICNHLTTGEGLGFNLGFDPDCPDDLYPDAWCNECESVLDAEGEWNEKSEKFSDIKILCSACYEEIRAKNWIQDEDSYHDLICSSFAYLQERQDSFMEKFKINDHERWDWQQDTGKLIFSHDGIPQVEADVSFSGSISTNSDTWMWAWANESLLDNVKSDSRTIRSMGEELGYHNLVAAHWSGTEVDGWEMTSIMAKELGAIGAYRTADDSGFTYMVVKNASWVNSTKGRVFGFIKRGKQK